MIVLDTGSRDGTAELARQIGAQVHHFTWAEDFSAARNAALALSEADWNLVLYADEVLSSDSGPALQALREVAPDFLGRIEIISCFTQGDQHGGPGAAGSTPEQYSTSWMTRVLPGGCVMRGASTSNPRLSCHAAT